MPTTEELATDLVKTIIKLFNDTAAANPGTLTHDDIETVLANVINSIFKSTYCEEHFKPASMEFLYATWMMMHVEESEDLEDPITQTMRIGKYVHDSMMGSLNFEDAELPTAMASIPCAITAHLMAITDPGSRDSAIDIIARQTRQGIAIEEKHEALKASGGAVH